MPRNLEKLATDAEPGRRLFSVEQIVATRTFGLLDELLRPFVDMKLFHDHPTLYFCDHDGHNKVSSVQNLSIYRPERIGMSKGPWKRDKKTGLPESWLKERGRIWIKKNIPHFRSLDTYGWKQVAAAAGVKNQTRFKRDLESVPDPRLLDRRKDYEQRNCLLVTIYDPDDIGKPFVACNHTVAEWIGMNYKQAKRMVKASTQRRGATPCRPISFRDAFMDFTNIQDWPKLDTRYRAPRKFKSGYNRIAHGFAMFGWSAKRRRRIMKRSTKASPRR